MIEYIAHKDESGRTQTVLEHSKSVARKCSSTLNQIKLGRCGYLLGILHDMGKMSDDFQEHIIDEINNGAIHSFAAPSYIYRNYHNKFSEKDEKIAIEIICIAMSCHHGLVDCIKSNEDGSTESEILHRVNENKYFNAQAEARYFDSIISADEIESLINDSVIEICSVLSELYNNINRYAETDNTKKFSKYYFYSGLIRLLTSALMNADKSDTIEWTYGFKYPDYSYTNWNTYDTYIDEKLSTFKYDTEINRCKKEMSDSCAEFAVTSGDGIYKLDLPTGAGKTLCSLRYAIKHNNKYNKSRVIYIAPFLSILDQNAEEIKNTLHNHGEILEHHSNVVNDSGRDKFNYHLGTDTWENPIIASTLVQLLEIMFSEKSSSIRRFQGLINSTIIIDEVQSIPTRDTYLVNLMCNFLNCVCKCNIILCSATMPIFDSVEYKMDIYGEPIINSERLAYYKDVFKRTVIHNLNKKIANFEAAKSFINNKIEEVNSLLVVCNTKNEAIDVYNNINFNNVTKFFLSSNLCPEHRISVISHIIDALKENKKVVCVSTQVIEAGVDISFECAIRFCAGLDSIVQTAGRVNRYKEYDNLCDVYVIPKEAGRIINMDKYLHDIVRGQDSFRNVANDSDIINPDNIIENYYRDFMGGNEDKSHKIQDEEKNIINTSVFHLMAFGYKKYCYDCAKDNGLYLCSMVKTAAKYYEVFSLTESIIVPYHNEELLNDLRSDACKEDLKHRFSVIEKLNRYTVNLQSNDFKKMNNIGFFDVLFEEDGNPIYILRDGHYDENLGMLY